MAGRKIIDRPVTGGLFPVPATFDRDDEVIWSKVRLDASRLSSYQDSRCGPFPNTFDKTGAYLCSGCNKLAAANECLIRIQAVVKDPAHSSCMYWETINDGDMEVRYSPKGRLGDGRISFGTTTNSGFGCFRCEYGVAKLKQPDSEGRDRWCSLKGMPVEDRACCAENDPLEPDEIQQVRGFLQSLRKPDGSWAIQ